MTMKTILFSFSLIIALAQYSCNSASTGKSGQEGQATVNTSLKTDEFEKKLLATEGGQLIDVRTPEEFAVNHLANATNMDFNGDDFAEKIKTLDRNKPVFVYCLSGGRSSSAASQLAEAGFKEVYNMAGGMLNWQSEGKAVVTGEAPQKTSGMTAADFSKLTSSKEYVLVDFNATWCGPCKAIAPMLESFASKRKDKLLLAKIDVDMNSELAQAKGINSIPYLELYKNGKLVWKRVGSLDEETLLRETGL
ncbi:MAG: thioredoxin family protein [Bacteroidetes bacterium]|nr:MAG: thioredoxin family protein [Bacteroidota bacterium]